MYDKVITNTDYAVHVTARCSAQFHPQHGDVGLFRAALHYMENAGTMLDAIKKAVFYGRGDVVIVNEPFDAAADMLPAVDMLHAVVGVMSEAGEIAGAVDAYFNDGSIDLRNMDEEMGDMLWYIQLYCNSRDITLRQLMTMNDAKLEARYGAVFSEAAAEDRDVDAEMAAMDAVKG